MDLAKVAEILATSYHNLDPTVFNISVMDEKIDRKENFYSNLCEPISMGLIQQLFSKHTHFYNGRF